MLAKQVWNLATQPNTLVASLFKGLYYPNTSFIKADLGSKPSPYWRALIWGKSLLDRGLGWKVGNVININLRNDNWLKGITHFKLTQPQSTPSYIAKVSKLIDNSIRSWKTKLLIRYIALST